VSVEVIGSKYAREEKMSDMKERKEGNYGGKKKK
jgi:hypothetical protein